ncbi:hypothetical protein KY317_01140, partial [Candidatus Woesearchaeota archaeon]|nr:hypothetical protein [Candidatus Woesearchaeota archaeon]
KKLKKLKVLVIGDTIIDEYIFTLPKGRAIKDPILSLDFIRNERYAGGILAILNSVSRFVDKLNLVTMIGEHNSQEKFIRKVKPNNAKLKFFIKKNSPTTLKRRYIDNIRKGKLFKVEYINDNPIDSKTEFKIIKYLKKELPKYDMVIVGDFGHGFITKKIVNVLEKYSRFLAANIQTNSTNMGFNYITKYNKIDYLTSNENEIRLVMSNRFGNLVEILKKLKEKTKFKNILLTRGGEGCSYITNSGNVYSGISLTNNIRDVVGAGDAVFAVTSLLNYNKIDGELLIFLANCVGGMAVGIIGNKKNINKSTLMKFIKELK